MTVGLNSRPIEWSRLPEPHPPDAGCWCSRNKRRPYVSLIWCEHAIGSWKRAQTLDPKQRPENCYEPLNLTLDCLHAHVNGHSSSDEQPTGLDRGHVKTQSGVTVTQVRAAIAPIQLR